MSLLSTSVIEIIPSIIGSYPRNFLTETFVYMLVSWYSVFETLLVFLFSLKLCEGFMIFYNDESIVCSAEIVYIVIDFLP